MALKAVQFLALTFTALALVPYGAHLFSLPNKIGMTAFCCIALATITARR